MDPQPSLPTRDDNQLPLPAAALTVDRAEHKAWKRIAGKKFALVA
jgi:hypothetical protein